MVEARAQAVHRAKHRRHRDQASLEAGLSREVDEGQADERGDEPLPRHARQRHDHAEHEQNDPRQVLEHQSADPHHRVAMRPERRPTRAPEMIDRPAHHDDRDQCHAAHEQHHRHDDAPPPVATAQDLRQLLEVLDHRLETLAPGPAEGSTSSMCIKSSTPSPRLPTC